MIKYLMETFFNSNFNLDMNFHAHIIIYHIQSNINENNKYFQY